MFAGVGDTVDIARLKLLNTHKGEAVCVEIFVYLKKAQMVECRN